MSEKQDFNHSNEPCILIVEDNKAIRSSMGQWLHHIFSDFEFIQAESGEEALELAITRMPILVLMDIGLPKMNGIEAIRLIKTRLPETRAIVLSIHEEFTYRKEAFAAGASAYVPKRTMHGDLVPAIKKILNQGRS
jgi:YesN/AraC family two-component response regulator